MTDGTKVHFEKTKFEFRCVSGTNNIKQNTVDLFGEIDPKDSKHRRTDRSVLCCVVYEKQRLGNRGHDLPKRRQSETGWVWTLTYGKHNAFLSPSQLFAHNFLFWCSITKARLNFLPGRKKNYFSLSPLYQHRHCVNAVVDLNARSLLKKCYFNCRVLMIQWSGSASCVLYPQTPEQNYLGTIVCSIPITQELTLCHVSTAQFNAMKTHVTVS